MKLIILSAFLLFMTQSRVQSETNVILNSILEDYPVYIDPVIPFDVVYNLSKYSCSRPLLYSALFRPRHEWTSYLLTLFSAAPPPVFGYDVYESTTELPIPTYYIVCQAFKDDAGKYPLGKPFKKAPPGTQRFSKTLISVGSIYCSDAAAVQAYIKSRPADGIPTVRAVPIPYVDVVIIACLECGLSTVALVPVDNSIIPITLPNDENFGSIFDLTAVNASQVSCQLYQDEKATKKIGGPILKQYHDLNKDKGYVAKKVKAVRCKRI